MGPATPVEGSFVHVALRDATVVRYFHGLLTLAGTLCCIALVLGREGAERRAAWESCALVLGANGVASLVGIPVLLALTARWRRPGREPLVRLGFDEEAGALRLHGEGPRRHRIQRARVTSVHTETISESACRVTVTTGAAPFGDQTVLEVSPGIAARISAFFGPQRSVFDAGVRSTSVAGTVFSSTYAACCVAGLLAYTLLRARIPREVFEHPSATESAGWALGLAVAGFAPFHALLSSLTPMPDIEIGIDGLAVRRFGRTRRVAWSDLRAVTSRGANLELTVVRGRRETLSLWPMKPSQVERLVATLRARLSTGDAAPGPAEIDAPGVPYRLAGVDGAALVGHLVAARSTPEARLRVARRIVVDEATGGSVVLRAAAATTDPDLRSALIEVAAVADEGAIEAQRSEARADVLAVRRLPR